MPGLYGGKVLVNLAQQSDFNKYGREEDSEGNLFAARLHGRLAINSELCMHLFNTDFVTNNATTESHSGFRFGGFASAGETRRNMVAASVSISANNLLFFILFFPTEN